jgi:pimeloyl-ACP methyl ester carboxylesterase
MTLDLPNVHWHCRRFGSGSRIWIALHGFGQDGSIFSVLEQALPPDFSIYALDLPFHGDSVGVSPTFSRADLQLAIQAILNLSGQTTYSALGFSFGCRLWLGMLAEEMYRWDALLLLSPDGIHTHWLSLLDKFSLSWRRRILNLVKHPAWLLALADRLHRLQLIDYYSLRFLNTHFASSDLQKQLEATWLSAVDFRRASNRLLKQLGESGKPLGLINGGKDFLIKDVVLQKWAQKIPLLSKTTIPDAGHWLLRHKQTPKLFRFFVEKMD